MKKLYHAAPTVFSGTILEPRTTCEINGKTDTYIFAADDKKHALTYTVPKGVRLMNAHIKETGAQIMVVDRESTIGDPELTGGLFSFYSDKFAQAIFGDGPSNQWVSTTQVDLSSAKYTPVPSFNNLMKEGIQIYQIGETEDFSAHTLYEALCDQSCNIDSFIKERLQNGQIRWMNEDREINPEDPFPGQKNDVDEPPLSRPESGITNS